MTASPIDGVKSDVDLAKKAYKYRRLLQVTKIPKLGSPLHVICMMLNIFLPGIGTLVAACYSKNESKKKWNFIFGVLQLLLSVVLIGWMWSVIWGVLIFIRNRGKAGLIPDKVLEHALK
ncbi:stum [Acrasis kona]|uniref:Stum n=1 Tax=Acrasis kona TaxID=1008807 RepID=A0AAW2ZQ33_9EUKA